MVAIPSERGRQVALIVDVWYDAGTKRVHVTSNDPDLPPEGLHTNLKPGSQADRSARAMLVNVWYDAGTKRVTSNDPDLPPEGLHTNLKPGSQADRSARAM